jgi:hypothetical protein
VASSPASSTSGQDSIGAAGHGLAAQPFVVFVHHAVVVGHMAARHHLIGVDHDADEAVVQRQIQVQDGQAGLRGNGHGHLVGDDQALGARELLARQKALPSVRRASRFGGLRLCRKG